MHALGTWGVREAEAPHAATRLQHIVRVCAYGLLPNNKAGLEL